MGVWGPQEAGEEDPYQLPGQILLFPHLCVCLELDILWKPPYDRRLYVGGWLGGTKSYFGTQAASRPAPLDSLETGFSRDSKRLADGL